MVMAAKFYTDAELKTARNKAVEIAADGVASFTAMLVRNLEGRFSLRVCAFGNQAQR